MDSSTLLYLLAALVVLVILVALFSPDRFRVMLKFLGFHAEVEGGSGPTGAPRDAARGEQQDGGGAVWEAKAEGSSGAQVAAGVGNVQSIGDALPEPPVTQSGGEDAVPLLRATAKDAPGAQVAAGIGNRQHRDAIPPADGEAAGKGQ